MNNILSWIYRIGLYLCLLVIGVSLMVEVANHGPLTDWLRMDPSVSFGELVIIILLLGHNIRKGGSK